MTEYPELMKSAKDLFPVDTIERAKELLDEIVSVGAYSHSQGVPLIRKSVANFIQGTKNSKTSTKGTTDSKNQNAMGILLTRITYS